MKTQFVCQKNTEKYYYLSAWKCVPVVSFSITAFHFFPRLALTCKFFGQNDAMCPTIREILITDHLKSAKRHLPQMLREMSGNKRRAFAARTDNRWRTSELCPMTRLTTRQRGDRNPIVVTDIGLHTFGLWFNFQNFTVLSLYKPKLNDPQSYS